MYESSRHLECLIDRSRTDENGYRPAAIPSPGTVSVRRELVQSFREDLRSLDQLEALQRNTRGPNISREADPPYPGGSHPNHQRAISNSSGPHQAVLANDSAGLQDMARVFIYLVREDQRVRFVLRQHPPEVRERIDIFRESAGEGRGNCLAAAQCPHSTLNGHRKRFVVHSPALTSDANILWDVTGGMPDAVDCTLLHQ
uniref:Uncharacterized protein n=1 Tax=Timema cristinae TaxID=61476 RepID=A0A7R9H5L6_TIMCR|nr:unnamed protein product [Timema cristinae]